MADAVPPERASEPEALVRQLIDLLDVEEIDTDLYRGPRQPGGVAACSAGR
ncbi:MAG: hypothetical protein WDN24_02735 [Sphingomonas sp.]